MRRTITTHTEDSPVCIHCKKKSPAWFTDHKVCSETGQAPKFAEVEIEVTVGGGLRVYGLSSGERINRGDK